MLIVMAEKEISFFFVADWKQKVPAREREKSPIMHASDMQVNIRPGLMRYFSRVLVESFTRNLRYQAVDIRNAFETFLGTGLNKENSSNSCHIFFSCNISPKDNREA